MAVPSYGKETMFLELWPCETGKVCFAFQEGEAG